MLEYKKFNIVGFAYQIEKPIGDYRPWIFSTDGRIFYTNNNLYEELIPFSSKYEYFLITLKYDYKKDYELIKYLYSNQKLPKAGYSYQIIDDHYYLDATTSVISYYTNNMFTSNVVYIDDFLLNTSYALLIAAILVFIFTAIVCYIFISFSIENQKRSIGILRSLGVSKRAVNYIYLIESAITLILSAIIALIGTRIAIYFISDFLYKRTLMKIINYHFVKQTLIILAGVSIITLISSYIPIQTITKQMPINIIKNKKG